MLDYFFSSRWTTPSFFSATAWVLSVSKWGRCLPFLYWSVEIPNNPTGLTSPHFQGRLALGDSKIHFNNTFVGTTNLTYNGGFASRLYMTKYINDIPNRTNNISWKGNNNNNTKYNILCSYISLTLPLNKEGTLKQQYICITDWWFYMS